jgi:alpha-L-fucosidase 2
MQYNSYKKIIFILLFCLIHYSGHTQNAGSKPMLHLDVNWASHLQQHDLVWHSIPKDYFAGAYVGNGLLGTILFKDDQLANTLRFEIGRTDVYDHRTASPSAYETSRLPIGQLLLTTVGSATKVSIRTDLWNAEIRGELITTQGSLSFRCFAPSDEELIIVNLKTTGKESGAKFSFRPQLAQSARYIAKRAMGLELNVVYQQNPNFIIRNEGEIEVITQPLLMGDDYATAWRELQNIKGERTVLLTVANRWGKYRKSMSGSAMDAVATIQAASKKSLKNIVLAHRNWWHAYYPVSFVNFPDARLESFYWIQLYKLASATHPGKPVIDLLGPWFKPTAWPLLWMNLNVQLTYFTMGVTNHTSLEDNLYQLLDRHTQQMIDNVPLVFRNDCAGIRNPVGFDDLYNPLFLTTDKNNVKEGMNIIVLPWLMQMYYLHYRRLMDDARLREKIYPLMRRAFNVYVRTMIKGEDGLYHIPFTYSDEYGDAKETSLNIALAHWGFKTLIATADRLKIKDSLLPIWKDRLANMADFNINEDGIMIGKDKPLASPHRHFSHLFTIFPLYDMTKENAPNRIPLMEKSITHFTSLDGDNCMYKFSGAASLWASLGKGDSALFWLKRSLEILPRFGKPPGPSRIPTVTQNTFYSERENPTFESPIASSRSMLDMMFQSWGGIIHVFPAMPTLWENASFYQLRAEGAFLVSAVRMNGKTKFIHVKSLAGEPCIIASDLLEDVKLVAPPSVKLLKKGNQWVLTLKKGQEAIIYTGKKPASFTIKANSLNPNEMNSWGVK